MISIAPIGVFSIAYTKTSKCFSLVYEVALLFQVNVDWERTPPDPTHPPRPQTGFYWFAAAGIAIFFLLSFAPFQAVFGSNPTPEPPGFGHSAAIPGRPRPQCLLEPQILREKTTNPRSESTENGGFCTKTVGVGGGANGGGVLGQKGAKNGIFGFEADFFSSFL